MTAPKRPDLTRAMRPWAGPAGTLTVYSPSHLTRGDRIVWDHRIWRVLGVDADEGRDRPFVVRVRPDGESLEWTATDGDVALGAGPYTSFNVYADTDHLPVCAVCGGPWPCKHLHDEVTADKAIARAERFAIPGVCPACLEPVSTRQLRQTWQVNLYALDRDQPVTFHLRRQCEHAAITYDRAVMAAGMPSQLGHKEETP